MEQFGFAIDTRFMPVLLPLGVRTSTAWLRIDEDIVSVRFGFFNLHTTRENIKGYELSGDYKVIRAIGLRASFADGGVTFGTNTRRGLCVKFAKTVSVRPGFRLRHPGMMVTVDDIDGLAAALEARGIARSDA